MLALRTINPAIRVQISVGPSRVSWIRSWWTLLFLFYNLFEKKCYKYSTYTLNQSWDLWKCYICMSAVIVVWTGYTAIVLPVKVYSCHPGEHPILTHIRPILFLAVNRKMLSVYDFRVYTMLLFIYWNTYIEQWGVTLENKIIWKIRNWKLDVSKQSLKKSLLKIQQSSNKTFLRWQSKLLS